MKIIERWRLAHVVCGATGHVECHAARWLWQVIPVCLLFLGIFGNLLTIIVLSRRYFRIYPTALILQFLAGADMMLLSLSVTRVTLVKVADMDVKDLSVVNCALHEWLVYTAAGFAIWLRVVLSLERCAFVRLPDLARKYISRRTVVVTVLITLVTVAMSSSSLLLTFRLRRTTATHDNHTLSSLNTTFNDTSIETSTKCVFDSSERELSYYTQLMIIHVLFFFIPLCTIIVSNGVVIHALLRRRKRIHPHSAPTTFDAKVNSTTRILFVLTGTFLAAILPYSAFNMATNFISASPSPAQLARLQLGDAIVTVLFWSGLTINFLVYVVTGSAYRREFQKLVQEIRTAVSHLVHRPSRDLTLPPPQAS